MAALDTIRHPHLEPVAQRVAGMMRTTAADLAATRRENATLRKVNADLRADNELLGKYNAELLQELCRARGSH